MIPLKCGKNECEFSTVTGMDLTNKQKATLLMRKSDGWFGSASKVMLTRSQWVIADMNLPSGFNCKSIKPQ